MSRRHGIVVVAWLAIASIIVRLLTVAMARGSRLSSVLVELMILPFYLYAHSVKRCLYVLCKWKDFSLSLNAIENDGEECDRSSTNFFFRSCFF